MNEDDKLKLSARTAFVKIIKEENFYSDHTKQSLRQHWNGALSGFADYAVQARWGHFWEGWQRGIEAQKVKDLAAVGALNNVLDFAVGAIADAIYREDGLDGGAGERVLQLIAEVKKHGTFNINLVEHDEMLRMFNLASDESTAT